MRTEHGGSKGRKGALRLLVLTLIAPGSAQMLAGNFVVGFIAILGYTVLLGIGTGAVLGLALGVASGESMLAGLVDPEALGRLRIALMGFGVCWLGLLIDAWRLGRPNATGKLHRVSVALVALGLVGAIAAGTLFSVQGVDETRTAVRTVFKSQHVSAPKYGRYNILLLGGDAGPDRKGLRPDSINVVSVDEASGRAVMFGLPRNLQEVPFPRGSAMDKAWPWGFNCRPDCLLNAVYMWAEANRHLFPRSVQEPGLLATRQAVEEVTGLDINYYVMVDMAGFRGLVDAVGGVTLDVRHRIPVAGLTRYPNGSPGPRWISPGRRHLDGTLALAYARSRSSSSDYHRMGRQRCVMGAMLRQLQPTTVLSRFRELARASGHMVRTDIPLSQLGKFTALARRAKAQPVLSVEFVPPMIRPAHPDIALIRDRVQVALAKSRSSRTVESAKSWDLDAACG